MYDDIRNVSIEHTYRHQNHRDGLARGKFLSCWSRSWKHLRPLRGTSHYPMSRLGHPLLERDWKKTPQQLSRKWALGLEAPQWLWVCIAGSCLRGLGVLLHLIRKTRQFSCPWTVPRCESLRRTRTRRLRGLWPVPAGSGIVRPRCPAFRIPGLVTNSFLFCWLFTIKDRCK